MQILPMLLTRSNLQLKFVRQKLTNCGEVLWLQIACLSNVRTRVNWKFALKLQIKTYFQQTWYPSKFCFKKAVVEILVMNLYGSFLVHLVEKELHLIPVSKQLNCTSQMSLVVSLEVGWSFRDACDYHPSHKTSPQSGHFHTILLGDRGMCVCVCRYMAVVNAA